nr:DUF4233 domain-containing protein [Angustibacter aerolatus]
MAFSAFAEAPVDAMVVEVGLGGTWDSTNVADGQVAVITPIAIDHERLLGSTRAAIAGEKAGIIKAGAVAVLGLQEQDAAEVLLHRAGEVGADVAVEGQQIGVLAREVAVGGQVVTVQGLGGVYPDLFLPLHGEHQAHNLACALAAVEAFVGGGRDRLDLDLVRDAVAGMDSPGRLEVVRRSPTVVVDAAHNPAGAEALAGSLEEAFAFSRLVGVVAVLQEKDPLGILEALEPVLDEIVVTRTSSSRSTPPDEPRGGGRGGLRRGPGARGPRPADRPRRRRDPRRARRRPRGRCAGDRFGHHGRRGAHPAGRVVSDPSTDPAAEPVQTARPPRSLRRTFASMVLVGDVFVAGFAALAAKDLTTLPGSQIVIGWLVLTVLGLLAAGMLRSRAGYALGWVEQVLLLLTGVWLPVMWFIGLALAVTWVVLLVKGARADVVTARRLVEEQEWQRTHGG